MLATIFLSEPHELEELSSILPSPLPHIYCPETDRPYSTLWVSVHSDIVLVIPGTATCDNTATMYSYTTVHTNMTVIVNTTNDIDA